jgi:MFS family permease
MMAARLIGDWLNRRLGAATLMRWGSALAAVALAGMLVAASVPVAIVGFFLVGVGVANAVPIVFSAAGHTPGKESGPNIAAVSSMGSIGFLAGPPFFGFLADATSLPLALGTLCIGLAAVVLAANAVGRGEVGPAMAEPAPVR